MVPELSYAGQASSGAVFSALDTVAQALANDSKTTGATDVPKGGAPDFDQLHSRHFSVLFEKALLKDLRVEGDFPGPVQVLEKDTPFVTLDLSAIEQNETFWKSERDHLRDIIWQRSERLEEINLQLNDILSFFGLIAPLNPSSMPWTVHLLQLILNATFSLIAEVKFNFWLGRPAYLCPEIRPVIQMPGHSSFPSGHATQSFMMARFVGYMLFGKDQIDLRRIAARIANNRSFAGVHYPVDSTAGAVLGDALAAKLLDRVFGLNLKVMKSTQSFSVHLPETDHPSELPRGYAPVEDSAELNVSQDVTAMDPVNQINKEADPIIRFIAAKTLSELNHL